MSGPPVVVTGDIPDAFFLELASWRTRHGWDPAMPLAVMLSESSIEVTARNRFTHARGLLQWLPGNAFGLSDGDLVARGFVGQAKLAERWFLVWQKNAGRRFARIGDFYWSTLAPGTMNDPEPIAVRGGNHADIYAANTLLDPPPRTGTITRATLERRVKIVQASAQDGPRWREALARLRAVDPGASPWPVVALVAMLGCATYAAYRFVR